MVVHPVIQRAGDDFLGVVAEVVIDGDGRVAGEFLAALADFLERSTDLRRAAIVRVRAVRTQRTPL